MVQPSDADRDSSGSNLLSELQESLRRLPGLGPSSAQRIALHLLTRRRADGEHLGEVLQRAMKEIGFCELCGNFSERERCSICVDPNRDNGLICVLAKPADLIAIERAGFWRGRYFVLHGLVSPIENRSPEDIGLPRLAELLDGGAVSRLMLALSPSAESEATALLVSEMADERGLGVRRLAVGLPLGGDIEFSDNGTLAQSFAHAVTLVEEGRGDPAASGGDATAEKRELSERG